MKFPISVLVAVLMSQAAPPGIQETKNELTVRLESCGCEPTRRLRCRYAFAVVKNGKDTGEFLRVLFYDGEDRNADKMDAIERLDRFFDIEEHLMLWNLFENRLENDPVGYKKPVVLRIKNSILEFIKNDGTSVIVNIDRKTKP